MENGEKGLSYEIRFDTQHKAIEAEASACATLRENGNGCRAEALPKVRTMFEDAHPFREVRILENPGDSFEGAHPFPRCAPKTEAPSENEMEENDAAANAQAMSLDP